ncbi:MAG: hypothetical protein M5U26_01255 [Planctomycetota bacterium]|nr:hypothetical protein [Planctomycetota bacterium]
MYRNRCLGSAVALLLACSAAIAAEPAPAAAEPTFEAQLETLQGAFAEAVRTRDWTMLELAAEGFKAAGLKGVELELACTRAERDAALPAYGQYGHSAFTRATVLTWGLCARVLAGHDDSRAELRAWAARELTPVPPADYKLWQKEPAAYASANKAYAEYQGAADLRDNALLALARLGEPGVLERACACLRQIEAPAAKQQWGGFSGGYNQVHPLVLAVLFADPREGWTKLMEIVNRDGEEAAAGAQRQILGSLLTLSSKNGAWGMAPREFTLEKDLSEKLPTDAGAQLAGSFAAMLKRWQPAEGAGYDYTLQSLLYQGYMLPREPEQKELLAALEELKGTAGRRAKRQVHRPGHRSPHRDAARAAHAQPARRRPPARSPAGQARTGAGSVLTAIRSQIKRALRENSRSALFLSPRIKNYNS